MSEVTVAQLANDVRIPVDRLLNQLAEKGITKESGDDVISEKEKRDLLTFLRQSHGKKATAGETASKITLKRKSVSELKQPASTTRTLSPRGARDSGKTVSVEVRKKRTIVKGATAEETERLQREAEEARQALADQEAQRKAVELENEARRRAEEDRRRREEETKRAHEDRVKAEEEAQRQADAAAQLQKEEEERKRKEELERARKELETAQRAGEALAYALRSPGKRVRPALVVAGVMALWHNEGRFDFYKAARDATVVTAPAEAEAVPGAYTGALRTDIPITGEYVTRV